MARKHATVTALALAIAFTHFTTTTRAARQLHHDLPLATPLQRLVSSSSFSPDGWSPRPTPGPQLELLLQRRQEDEDDPSFCGYLEGDPALPMGCDYASTCLYDTQYSWFGCCTGTVIEACNLVTACVQSAVSEAKDPFVTAW
jgi:hypothetical protein